MPKVTISIDDDLLEAGRRFARDRKISLSALIRDLLSKAVANPSRNRMREMFKTVDGLKLNTRPWKWNRAEIYDL